MQLGKTTACPSSRNLSSGALERFNGHLEPFGAPLTHPQRCSFFCLADVTCHGPLWQNLWTGLGEVGFFLLVLLAQAFGFPHQDLPDFLTSLLQLSFSLFPNLQQGGFASGSDDAPPSYLGAQRQEEPGLQSEFTVTLDDLVRHFAWQSPNLASEPSLTPQTCPVNPFGRPAVL